MPNFLSGLLRRGSSAPVSIKRDYYSMATTDGKSAEIIMYGDIVEAQPIDCWTGNPIEGQYIIESEFLKDLNAVSDCKTITIRMNSLGGDAGVSILIHNRLRELAAKGTALICIVDGVAMSGGSLIMCACDTVRVNPSSLVMIHNCWVFLFGGYSANELRQQATQNDAWDKAQLAIYKRKCSLSDADISSLMAATTYMTGREAVEKGFANELLEDAEPLDIAASADGRSLFVRGRQMHLTPGTLVPDNIPTVSPEASAPVETDTKQPTQSGGNEGGNKPMANTVEELRKEYPALVAQMESDIKAAAVAPASGAISTAVAAERQRVQEINEIATSINDPVLVKEAMFGANPCTAQELAFRAMKQQAQKGQDFLDDLDADYETSGAAGVTAVATPREEVGAGDKASIAAQAKADAEAYNKMKGTAK